MSKFVVLSRSVREEVERGYAIPGDRIDVVQPGLDTDFFHRASREEIQALLGRLGIVPPYILWASSYRAVKNIVTLVKAFQDAASLLRRRGQPLSLVIAGYVEGAYHEEVKAAATDAHTKSNIHFLKWVGDDLPALISGARASIVPSLYEGFSFPLLESMACGVPVIATRVGGITEAGGSAALYVNDPTDRVSISAAIVRVVSDDELHQRLARRGLTHTGHFTLDKFGDRMLRFYQRTASGSDT